LADRVYRNNFELTANEYPAYHPVASPLLKKGKTVMDYLTSISSSLRLQNAS